MNAPGRVGSGGTSSGSSGRTSRGVISTISSVCSARSALLLNSVPMIGSRLSSGIACRSVCDRLFSRPAMANDWPSRSSTSVSARRVISAGNAEAGEDDAVGEVERAHLGLAAFSRITSPAIVGVKVRRMPNSLYCTRHLADVAADHRNRNFAAGEEAGLLAVVGDQVRLGQALEEAAALRAP